MRVSIMWFRRDLRLADNEALTAAVAESEAVVPVFVSPPETPHGPGDASRRWMNRSLAGLDAGLRERGSCLVLRTGSPVDELRAVAVECGAEAVFCTRDRAPEAHAEEEAVRAALSDAGIALRSFGGQLLAEPDEIVSRAGTPFRVFTPFYAALRAAGRPPTPLPASDRIARPRLMPASSGPLTPPPGGPDLSAWWTPGERSAHERLQEFAAGPVLDYGRDRDLPALRATSELSPRLAWGELSPAQVVHAVAPAGEQAEPFLRQLAWREFSYHVLHHAPQSADRPLRREFEEFPWSDDERHFSAWKRGETGFPIVDAGMRQLLATGWMHNRVRLVVASFLTKDLLVPWQDGERFFRERLVDYDPAANAFNWQWVAGSGADAAPYFRIFNPRLQGRRFDPEGTYVRRWVPELSRLDVRWVHRPHEAPDSALAEAGVTLGRDYPLPIVDHAEARERALAAFSAIRGARGERR